MFVVVVVFFLVLHFSSCYIEVFTHNSDLNLFYCKYIPNVPGFFFIIYYVKFGHVLLLVALLAFLRESTFCFSFKSPISTVFTLDQQTKGGGAASGFCPVVTPVTNGRSPLRTVRPRSPSRFSPPRVSVSVLTLF